MKIPRTVMADYGCKQLQEPCKGDGGNTVRKREVSECNTETPPGDYTYWDSSVE